MSNRGDYSSLEKYKSSRLSNDGPLKNRLVNLSTEMTNKFKPISHSSMAGGPQPLSNRENLLSHLGGIER